jgi:hypothetical protein
MHNIQKTYTIQVVIHPGGIRTRICSLGRMHWPLHAQFYSTCKLSIICTQILFESTYVMWIIKWTKQPNSPVFYTYIKYRPISRLTHSCKLRLFKFHWIVARCAKCAFVVPVYEISTKADHLPANKTELLDYIKNNMARQFHQVRNVPTCFFLCFAF